MRELLGEPGGGPCETDAARGRSFGDDMSPVPRRPERGLLPGVVACAARASDGGVAGRPEISLWKEKGRQ